MLPAELSIEDRRLFWRDYAKWCALFSAPEVDEQLAKLAVRDIVEEHTAPLRDWAGRPLQARTPYGTHRHLGKVSTHYMFHREGWERSEYVPCEVYMVPHQYQSLRHGAIIAPILHARYPWLSQFKCDFYSLHFYTNSVEEFYVRTERDYGGHRSLYVPYRALMAGDVDAIVRRNEEYLRWYTKSDETWSEMRNDTNVEKFLGMVGAQPALNP